MKKKITTQQEEQKVWEQLKGKIKDTNDSELRESHYLKERINSVLKGKKIFISVPKNSVFVKP